MSNKRKKLIIVCVCALIFTLAVILGYTYSKYVTSEEVQGIGSVAKWSFNGAISNTDSTTTKLISLADTLNSKNSIVSGKIAPGTSGSFKIIVNAKGSEVDVDYDVLLKDEETTKPANLYFTCNDLVSGKEKKYYSLAEMLKENESTHRSNMSGTITKDNNATPKVITVNWEWPYETTKDGQIQDAQDTNDSKIGDYTFSLSIVGKQVQ